MANVLNRSISKVISNRRIWCNKQYSAVTCYSCNNFWLNYPLPERKSKFNAGYKIPFTNIPRKYGYENIMYFSDKKEAPPEKLSLFQKFKQMYKEYWYILVPVHVVTSAVWFGGFYYTAKCGFDIVHLLESWHVSETLIGPLRDSSMGYVAVAYALYKIATPARYTVTLGGTTISINYLKKWGYIKPVPSTERMKQIYQQKKDNLTKSVKETKESFIEGIQETTEGIKEKKDSIIKTVKKTTGKKLHTKVHAKMKEK